MRILAVVLVASVVTAVSPRAWAASAKEIDVRVDVALERFYEEVTDGKKLIREAKGVLVFPKVFKAGFGLGGEYGEGALRVRGKTVDYYSTAAASFGFQIGVQKKSIILLFTQEKALKHFRESSGWKAGVDASVALATLGAGGAVDTAKLKEPILAFIFGQKGLMYNLTIEGAKFTKIKREK